MRSSMNNKYLTMSLQHLQDTLHLQRYVAFVWSELVLVLSYTVQIQLLLTALLEDV